MLNFIALEMRIKMKNEKIIGRVIETDTSKNLPSIFFKKAHQLVFSQLITYEANQQMHV